jgi:hypothetical protein
MSKGNVVPIDRSKMKRLTVLVTPDMLFQLKRIALDNHTTLKDYLTNVFEDIIRTGKPKIKG